LKIYPKSFWPKWSFVKSIPGSKVAHPAVLAGLRADHRRRRPQRSPLAETELKTNRSASGLDVMITIFCDFCQYSATKLAFFSTTNVMIKILHYLAFILVKNAYFFSKILKKS
jgi:hypothetical protein